MKTQIRIAEMNKESVIIFYRSQPLCFHNFGDPHKSRLKYFKEELKTMQRRDLDKVLSLANKYEINIMASRHTK